MPRVYVRSDDFAYGVFSFEPGKPKGAAEREPGDFRAVASFAADMHRVAPSPVARTYCQPLAPVSRSRNSST